MRRFLVTATPPTTNGDLHVGHLSGPYLGADVFCRAQRLLGNQARYVSGGDDHQTYVVTTAQAVEQAPEVLAARCTEQIRETLRLAEIELDAFTSPDRAYLRHVRGFFTELYQRGKLVRRTWRFPYCQRTGRYLLEAFVTGYCPECFAATCGAICETCGHPNDVDSLLYGQSTGVRAAAEVEQREVPILVLPLEDYREQFVRFYAEHRDTMRPRVLGFVREMLSRPLPDFPVTYPADWGVSVPLAGFGGQVFNVWAEMLPGLTHMAGIAGADWQAGSGYELVQFLGYDNTFYFSLAHLGLALAHGGLLTPTAIITNEFYHLDGSKFSTSRRHLIWARDLLVKHGADSARFYLALHNPEQQTANFTEAEFVKAVDAGLREPLARVEAALAGHHPVDGPEPALLRRYRHRMRRAYALETFSLRQAAQSTANLLALLAARASTDPDLAWHGLRAIAVLAGPLLPGLTERLRTRYAT
ncbi:class I tRNA ligase family protein [Kutzneria viridogrisea]|uniref:Methionyl-tRNA synthetase n=1 Tax=Kutzneria viridogrisea TaxID=47990 RepID=A0ABR6BCZ4_9PSEU|nr:methionyl-tRNA synthetase [Kutzneria viridogrisea]